MDISEWLINDPYFLESIDRAKKEMSEGIYLTDEEMDISGEWDRMVDEDGGGDSE